MAFNFWVEYTVLGGVLYNLLSSGPSELPRLALDQPLPLPAVIPEATPEPSPLPNGPNRDVNVDDTPSPGDSLLGIAKGVVSTLLDRAG